MEAFGIDPSPELQRLEVAILGQTAELDDVPPPACPYKGLASYQLDDAELFYGRDGLVAELIEAVRSASFVVVVGSSGAGKSSALRAGLVKAVETRKLSGLRQASSSRPAPPAAEHLPGARIGGRGHRRPVRGAVHTDRRRGDPT